ncbi:hypothetical protein GCM10023219_04850 [Stakelama sediminis]|uniref:Phytanoyl-CoA dioxygenase n=2 Tax=Stakelama sediminis TaxID=463200 RepID=A0A840YUF4_9SPHN|nr:hypothetical protein [Stakelama sediminis]
MPVGVEGEQIIVIDDALQHPDELIRFATTQRFDETLNGLYPGPRAPLPLDYAEAVVARATPLIAQSWKLGPIRPAHVDCVYSIVTKAPKQLLPMQRHPHIDTSSPWHFAVLHFLCDAHFGGTAFFRHRTTGFETITPDREAIWNAALEKEKPRRAALPVRYIADDDPDFERIATVGARRNRMLIYRSNLLHSGVIPTDMPLVADPLRGRLTANIFIGYRPTSP